MTPENAARTPAWGAIEALLASELVVATGCTEPAAVALAAAAAGQAAGSKDIT